VIRLKQGVGRQIILSNPSTDMKLPTGVRPIKSDWTVSLPGWASDAILRLVVYQLTDGRINLPACAGTIAQPAENHREPAPVPKRRGGLQVALPGLEKHLEKMDDADRGLEASAARIRDRVRRQIAVTANHQHAIYTKDLRTSGKRSLYPVRPWRRCDSR